MKADRSSAWSLVVASIFAFLLGIGLLVHQRYKPGNSSGTTVRAFSLGTSLNSSNAAEQGAHANTPDSTLPAELQGVPFDIALGCWHVRADSRGPQTFHVAAQADFQAGSARWVEAKDAINRTRTSNPGVHYVLVTKTLEVLSLSAEIEDVPHDLWYCPEVLYGTPIRIGNLYDGPKFAVSVDDWFTPWNWDCTFKNGTHSFAYVVQRQDKKELSGYDRTCYTTISKGGADGFLFDYVPEPAVAKLRFPRSYWGCENLAMYVFKEAGLTLVNMCPWYVPIHVHQGKSRNDGRLRINNNQNHVSTGLTLDISALCKQKNS